MIVNKKMKRHQPGGRRLADSIKKEIYHIILIGYRKTNCQHHGCEIRRAPISG
jgi:hypothetical protein